MRRSASRRLAGTTHPFTRGRFRRAGVGGGDLGSKGSPITCRVSLQGDRETEGVLLDAAVLMTRSPARGILLIRGR